MITLYKNTQSPNPEEIVRTNLLCVSGLELAKYIYENYDNITDMNVPNFDTNNGKTAWVIEIIEFYNIDKIIKIRIATEQDMLTGKKIRYCKLFRAQNCIDCPHYSPEDEVCNLDK